MVATAAAHLSSAAAVAVGRQWTAVAMLIIVLRSCCTTCVAFATVSWLPVAVPELRADTAQLWIFQRGTNSSAQQVASTHPSIHPSIRANSNRAAPAHLELS